MLLSLVSSLRKRILLCWHLCPLPFPNSDLQVPFYTCECNRTVRMQSSSHGNRGVVQIRAQFWRAGTGAAFFLEKDSSRTSSVSCGFHLPLFSFKVFLAAEAADQERETWMTDTSQYCQFSARFISAIRQEKRRFHHIKDHKLLWEMETRVGILGKEERDGSYTTEPGRGRQSCSEGPA